MRHALIGVALCVLLSSPARAELQVFQGTFTLLGIGTPAPVQTAIGVATVTTSGGLQHLNTLELPGGLFSIHTSVPITTGTLPLTSVQLDLTLGAGTFVRGGAASTLLGQLGAPGNVRLCVLLGCGLFFDVPLTEGGTHGIGLGGAPIVRPLGGFGTIALQGAPWKTKTVSVNTPGGTITLMGFAHGPLSNTSSTGAPQGVLQLVTPVAVTATVGGSPSVVPLFGSLQVKLLPEPGSLALCGTGALVLALLGVRRARR